MIRDLKIKVREIIGHCPIYEVGDEFSIREGYILRSDIPICLHSLMSIVPYYTALSRGTKPEELGLGKDKAYVQCLDPCKYTGGGTVIFEITIQDIKLPQRFDRC